MTGAAGNSGAGQAGTNGNPGTAGTSDTGTAGTFGDTGTAGTFGDAGTNGNTGTAGTSATGTAGTSATGTAGTSATGTAGTGGGTGGMGRGGTVGTGGGGATGRGGTVGTGGGGAGGSSRGGTTGTGGGGTTGRGGTTGGGGTGDLTSVGAPLDGQMMTGPCMQNTEVNVCATVAGACPDQNNSDIALRGVKTTDRTITMGGTSGVNYTAVLHIQGVVESKNYNGGTDQNSSTSLSSPNMDGWRVGGTPNTGNAYNVYMLRVTNPGATTSTTYYLNSLDPPGVENHTTYGINYTTPASGNLAFVFQGGAMVRIVAADSNCSMIKNCGPNPSGCMAPIVISNVEQSAMTRNPTFNFTTAYNGQWVTVAVKSVTQN